MRKSLEQHADQWDLRDPDFGSEELLFEVYKVMRERGAFVQTDRPFFDTGSESAWVSTRYEESYEVLRDFHHFSNEPEGGTPTAYADSVLLLDPPRQQKLRKVLNPYFSPARMEQLEQDAREVTDRLIDELIEAGQGDLAYVAWQQPGLVFFPHVLGMPVEDIPMYIEFTDQGLNGETAEARSAALLGLYQAVRDEMAERQKQPPRDDMVNVLLEATIDGEPLSFDAMVANAMLLVQAGLETTSSAMSFGFHYLGTHHDQRDLLVQNPDMLPSAVEEFIRFGGSVHGLQRRVASETEVAGQTFCPGETVVVNFAAANRDPREFEEPDRCILDRQTNRHLGFGAGAHRCLGSNLARMEFRVGLERVLARMPDFVVPPDADVEFRGNTSNRGYTHVPVTFTPGPRVG